MQGGDALFVEIEGADAAAADQVFGAQFFTCVQIGVLKRKCIRRTGILVNVDNSIRNSRQAERTELSHARYLRIVCPWGNPRRFHLMTPWPAKFRGLTMCETEIKRVSSPLRCAEPLGRSISGVGFFVLTFGTVVGSGWVVALGEWVAASGPGGAIVAFSAGGLLMAIIAAAYAELIAGLPRAGGEFLFVLSGLGKTAGFLTGWFLTLYIIGFTAFEAVALAWFLEMLCPMLTHTPVLYKVLGYNLTIFNLAVGITSSALLTWLNSHGAQAAVGVQRAATFSFIAISVILIVIGLGQGESENIRPFFAVGAGKTNSIPVGMLWTFSTVLLFLSGFQTAANAIEERSTKTTIRTVAYSMIGSVIVATIFYCLIIIVVSLLTPWRDMVSKPLPVAAAFEGVLPGGLATKIVLLAAAVSLIKTWNALHLSASRLLLAQAREGLLPAALAYIDPRHGVPIRAVTLVGAITTAWLFLGKGAILPIINMSTICVTIAMVLSLLSLRQLRAVQEDIPEFVMPGGEVMLTIAIVATSLAAVMAIITPFQTSRGLPIEIMIIGIWTALGICIRIIGVKCAKQQRL